MKNTLYFGKGSNNSKIAKLEKALGKKAYTFSLPSGYTCPGAKDCLSKFDRKLGKVVDGASNQFRCFATSLEATYPSYRANCDKNFALLKACRQESEMVMLILSSLPSDAEIVRIHVGGDFYSQSYMNAWAHVARSRPECIFYAYTKSVPFWFNLIVRGVPENFKVTVSMGGKYDSDVKAHAGVKRSTVVFSIQEAAVLGLSIDNDDSHAATGDDSFALLIHGAQPKGSRAARALQALKA